LGGGGGGERQRNSNNTLNVAVTGSGTITSSPTGINCGSDCTEDYPETTRVTLTATPAAGFMFDNWEGACNGNRSCVITMDQTREVTTVFAVEAQQSVLIENYSAPNDAFQLGEIPDDASGITWHAELEQFLVVQNNSATVYRYDENFAYLGQFRVNNISADTEGLAYVQGNQVMIISESNIASKIIVDGTDQNIDGSVPASQQYRILSPGPSNKDTDGIAVRKANNTRVARIYACQEGTQGSNMRVAYFDLLADSNELFDYESNLDVFEPYETNQTFAGVVSDLAGMVYDARTDHLIIVSQESRKAIQVIPETGAIVSELALNGAPQFEGATLGPNNELFFVSEGICIRIYTEN
jgi:uncharacterized protein YjiK